MSLKARNHWLPQRQLFVFLGSSPEEARLAAELASIIGPTIRWGSFLEELQGVIKI
ncbi:hypothetical protein N752_01015 [Desulforamulus aquiferis]|nr:hypothetical protein [Desulforamulus aquiferis]RYD07195.1 hypothetical protein N752_01015 [Desulforamulus aquiferis]